jgi:hypothetical protein
MSDSGEGRQEPDWSDDEQEISFDDLAYLRQVERRSYLMKRSRRNPAVWNKRYCVLSDKLWIINVRGVKPRAIRIDLTEPVNVYQVADSGGGDAATSSSSKNLSSKKKGEKTEKLYEFALDNGLAPEPYHFRAASTKELTAWQDDLRQRAKRSADDSVMQMAELIMSEETRMRSQRLQKSLESLLHSKVGEDVLDQLQSHTNDQNLEAIRDSHNTKALAAAAVVASVQTQGGGPMARPAGEFVVYNGASLPSDMERLEALNRNSSTSSGRNEERASSAGGGGNDSKGQQRRLFRRRSGSTSTTTSNTSNGDSSSSTTNYSNNNQRGQREKERSGAATQWSTSASAKGAKAAINAGLLAAAANTDRQQQQQQHGRDSSISARPTSTSQRRELMCKYYQETGVDSSGDSTDEDGNNEEGEGGTAGRRAKRGTPYLQVANLEVRRGLSLGHRFSRHHHHTTTSTITKGNRATVLSAGGGSSGAGYSAWNLHSALALVHAVNRFKELLRRDRSTPRYGCPERDQWALATGIFLEYLSLHVSAAVPSADGESGGGGGLVKATDACFGLSDGCVSDLYDAITANVEWCSREDPTCDRASSSSSSSSSSGGSVNKREEAPPSGGQDNSGSSSGSSPSFWGSVFGASTTSAGVDPASITASSLLPAADAEKAERGKRDASARAAATSEARAKFYVPFPSDTVTASSRSSSSSGFTVDPASVWGALMARPRIDANLRTHMVACRLLLHSDGGNGSNGSNGVVVAPPASLYDRVEAELEAVLGAGTNKHNSI